MNDSQKRKELAYIIILVLIVFISRAYLIQYKVVIGVDESVQLRMAQNFAHEKGLLNFDGITHNTSRPPLYSIIAGFLYLIVRDIEVADKIIFVFFGGMLAVPIYLISRRLFGRRAGYVSILLLIPSLALTETIMLSMTHVVLIFFVYMGLNIGLVALRKDKTLMFVLLGFCLGLAYLSRVDGFFYFLTIFVFIASSKGFEGLLKNKRTILNLLLFLIIFGACVIPYLFYIHSYTGEWTISRQSYDTFYAGQGFVEKGSLSRDAVIYGYKRSEELYGTPEQNKNSIFIAIVHNPRALLSRVAQNFRYFYHSFFSDAVYPLYLAFFSLLGLLFTGWTSVKTKDKLFLVFSSSPVFIYLAFHIEARYLTPVVPAMIVWSAGGISFLEKFFSKLSSSLRLKRHLFSSHVFLEFMKNILVGLIILFVCIIFWAKFDNSLKKGWLWSMSGFERDKNFGRELKDKVPPNSIMTSFTPQDYVAFYAETIVKNMPIKDDIHEFIDTLRLKDVKYLVLDSARSDLILLKPLLNWKTVPVRLRPYLQPFFQKEITHGRWYRVYKVINPLDPENSMRTMATQLRGLHRAFPFSSALYFGGYSILQSDSFFSLLSQKIQKIYRDQTIKIYNIKDFSTTKLDENVFFFLFYDGKLTDITKQSTLLFRALSQNNFFLWDFEDSADDWKAFQDLSHLSCENSVFKMKSTGKDPIMFGPKVEIPTLLINTLEVRLKVGALEKKGQAQLFWTTSNDGEWGSKNKWINFEITQDNEFHTYSIDLLNNTRFKKDKDDKLIELRFDPAVMKADIEIDYIKLSLLSLSELIEDIVFREWIRGVEGT
ncbi:hypothetical protein ES702_03221 [subsurface metagenome]